MKLEYSHAKCSSAEICTRGMGWRGGGDTALSWCKWSLVPCIHAAVGLLLNVRGLCSLFNVYQWKSVLEGWGVGEGGVRRTALSWYKWSLVPWIHGGGDSSVVRAPDSWLKGRGFESLLERRENFLLQGRLSVLTLISVSVPPPCYHSST